MLRSVTMLDGFAIHATDGVMGSVSDVIFDERTWAIRYIVVKTGTWLTGRRVLLSPSAFGPPNWASQYLNVGLTKEEVRKSPPIDVEKPLILEQLDMLHAYYQWPGLLTAEPAPALASPPVMKEAGHPDAGEDGGTHLCSASDWIGYSVLSVRDDEIGRVEGFLFDELKWRIHSLVVNTRSWLSRHKTLVDPHSITTVSRGERTIHLSLTKDAISQSTLFEPERLGAA